MTENSFAHPSPFFFHHLAILGTFAKTLKYNDSLLQIESNGIPGIDWEYYSPITLNGIDKIVSGNKQFNSLYIPSYMNSISLAGFVKKNYCCAFTDAWMRFEGEGVYSPETSLRIVQVVHETEMRDFIKVFQEAFGGKEDHEPYGKMPEEYAMALLDSFFSSISSFSHFLALDEGGRPIACGSVSIINTCAFFYCLGVIPKFRRRGVAKQIQMFRIKYALERGCKDIYLQTARDSINEVMNVKLGFRTVFYSSAYQLSY